MDFAGAVVAFVVAVGILVTVHEFGHFWVARRLGVRVLRFSVGFGRPIWSRRGAGGTEYAIGILPLGGYVKMLDEQDGEVPEAEGGEAFNRKPLWARSAIVLAGPAFNFLFAAFAWWLVFLIGTAGLRAVVGEVGPGSLAERAGLARGDALVAVEEREARTWSAVVAATLGEALDQDRIAVRWTRPDGGAGAGHLDLAGVAPGRSRERELLRHARNRARHAREPARHRRGERGRTGGPGRNAAGGRGGSCARRANRELDGLGPFRARAPRGGVPGRSPPGRQVRGSRAQAGCGGERRRDHRTHRGRPARGCESERGLVRH